MSRLQSAVAVHVSVTAEKSQLNHLLVDDVNHSVANPDALHSSGITNLANHKNAK